MSFASFCLQPTGQRDLFRMPPVNRPLWNPLGARLEISSTMEASVCLCAKQRGRKLIKNKIDY